MSQGFANVPTGGSMSATTFAGLLNTGLNAILSRHSGPSAPSNGPGSLPVLYQAWMDTTSSTLVKAKFYDGVNWPRIGTLDVSNSIWIPKQGGGLGSVATATTVDLGALPHTFVTLVGAGTINSFGSTPENGEWKDVYAGAAITLTNSASIICPGGVNLVLATGDTFRAIYDGGGVWLIKNVERISGAGVFTSGTYSGTVTAAAFSGGTFTGAAASFSTGDFSGVVSQNSTSHGFLARGTTAQRPSPVEGQKRYNTTRKCFEFWNGTVWAAVGVLPTLQRLIASGNYTTPAGVTYIKAKFVGGGGGAGSPIGGAGNDTTFAGVTAKGGSPGGVSPSSGVPGPGGIGGTSAGAGATLRIPGGAGAKGAGGLSAQVATSVGQAVFAGGHGGSNHLSGSGTTADNAGVANSGNGAGGLTNINSTNGPGASTGGAGGGEYVELWMAPTAGQVITFTIGAGGVAGSNSLVGGSGIVIVEEYYN